MTRPYSLDLRERVVAQVAAGRRVREVAQLFGVSVSCVVKWSQRARATGSPAAKQVGGYRPRKLAGERAWLLARLEERPDLTLAELQRELAGREIEVGISAIWSFLDREGLSFKKNPARQRARSA